MNRIRDDLRHLRPFVIGCVLLRVSVILVSLLVVWPLLIVTACSRPSVPTAGATSPDGRYRVELRELGRSIDRNFEVVLIDQQAATPTPCTIFTSPDEGAPPGTERFLWSKDSRAVLLVGKHFFTGEDDASSGGRERPYLLYDVVTESLWCNASQVSSLDRIEPDLLAGYGLREWNEHE